MELFQMSQARGFAVGGTVHVVINNQIGFTISDRQDARSTLYCTDVAKMVGAPVLHVNGDDPEAVVFCAQAAFDFRQRFGKDVVIDLVCYRRHGHNEADEPAATQPLMYQVIRAHKTPRELYADALLAQGVLAATRRRRWSTATATSSTPARSPPNWPRPSPTPRRSTGRSTFPASSRTRPTPRSRARSSTRWPRRSTPSPRTSCCIRAWPRSTRTGARWPRANCRRLGLRREPRLRDLARRRPPPAPGRPGQRRGTFFHRHAVLHDQKTDTHFIPLQLLAKNPDDATIVDSLLSEEAVMAFEYGYSTADPGTLDIWEAQFGDFANGAQVVIDQFISSGEAKWDRLCGLALFLPHGYEGQGPEHSSRRGWNASCSCARWRTCRCACRPRQRRPST